ncbi:hypothetical protein HPB52_014308 [Rhipicephalus sanguineus]|uniref:Uncharacterized protein n=1 Tax=Rhipicephalus sanguineus TaxID=34632 RepID=A0A9D4SR19_RHISA|nr:hypothetical protein HPB52_014308 [Rhipicephalus sanguineus]
MLDPVESKTGKYGVLSLRTPPASPTSTAGGADFESSDVLDDEESIDARRRGGYITDDTTRSLWSGRMSASLGGSGDVASCGAPSRRGLVGASVGAGSDELSTSGLKGVNCRVQEVVVRMRRRTHGRPPRLWSGIKPIYDDEVQVCLSPDRRECQRKQRRRRKGLPRIALTVAWQPDDSSQVLVFHTSLAFNPWIKALIRLANKYALGFKSLSAAGNITVV